MRKSKFSEEQIAFALRQSETGTSVSEVCRKMGISEAASSIRCALGGSQSVPSCRDSFQLEPASSGPRGSKQAHRAIGAGYISLE